MTAVTYLSKSACAAHIGRSPSYITWLKENGRMVLSPNGKQVDVLVTEALIRETADPSKAAVAARHQQDRLQRDVYRHVAAKSESTNMAAPPSADPAQDRLLTFRKQECIASITWRGWRRWSSVRHKANWWKSALCRKPLLKQHVRSITR